MGQVYHFLNFLGLIRKETMSREYIANYIGHDTKLVYWQLNINDKIKFPFKRKACQVYRVKYGRGRIW